MLYARKARKRIVRILNAVAIEALIIEAMVIGTALLFILE